MESSEWPGIPGTPHSEVSTQEQQVKALLRVLFQKEDMVELRFCPDKGSTGCYAFSEFFQAAELPAQAEAFNRRNNTYHIYFGIHPRKPGISANTSKEHCKQLDHCRCGKCEMCVVNHLNILPLDFDGCKEDGVYDAIQVLELPAPTILIMSGGGYHAYWKFSRPVNSDEYLGRLQGLYQMARDRGLNTEKGTPPCIDSSCGNLSRLFRLPGFFNIKKEYGSPRQVYVVDQNPGITCDPELLPVFTPKVYKNNFEPGGIAAPHELQEVAQVLNQMDADQGEGDCRYQRWLHVGMGLHAGTAGSDHGFDVWHQWSQNGSKDLYLEEGPERIRNRWNGFSAEGGINLGTIYWYAQEEGIELPNHAARDYGLTLQELHHKHEAEAAQAASLQVKSDQMPYHLLPKTLVDWVEEQAKALGLDPCKIVSTLIGHISGAIGNTRRLTIKEGWSEPPIIWTLLIMRVGGAKSPIYSACQQYVKSRQDQEMKDYANDMHQYELELKQYKEQQSKSIMDSAPELPMAPKRYFTSDFTKEALQKLLAENPRGVMISKDEGSSVFGSFDRYANKGTVSGEIGALCEYWGGDARINTSRKKEGASVYGKAWLTITTTIQSSIFGKIFGGENQALGLCQRFLLYMPRDEVQLTTTHTVSKSTQNAMNKLFDGLYSLQPCIVSSDFDCEEAKKLNYRPVEVSWASPQAFQEFIKQADAMTKRGQYDNDYMRTTASKLKAYIARFALLIQIVKYVEAGNDPGMEAVDLDSLNTSAKMMNWYYDEIKRISLAFQKDEVMEALRKHDKPVRVRTLYRGEKGVKGLRHLKTDEIVSRLEALVELGMVERHYRETNGKGGGRKGGAMYSLRSIEADED